MDEMWRQELDSRVASALPNVQLPATRRMMLAALLADAGVLEMLNGQPLAVAQEHVSESLERLKETPPSSSGGASSIK